MAPLLSLATVHDELEVWLAAQLNRISGKSELAKAIRYALGRIKKMRGYLLSMAA